MYFPRKDRRERAPRSAAQVDLRLARDLVDRFVAAGALTVLVGPSLPLRGRGVQPWPHHDDHLHVRLVDSSQGEDVVGVRSGEESHSAGAVHRYRDRATRPA